jgi:uncharacterized membrane protein
MVVLSYLWILALIPYLTKKDDPEVHWHAKNGLGLFIVDVLVGVVFFVISIILRNSAVSCGTGALNCIISIALFIVHVYCIIQAAGGKRPRIPVITDFAEKTL